MPSHTLESKKTERLCEEPYRVDSVPTSSRTQAVTDHRNGQAQGHGRDVRASSSNNGRSWPGLPAGFRAWREIPCCGITYQSAGLTFWLLFFIGGSFRIAWFIRRLCFRGSGRLVCFRIGWFGRSVARVRCRWSRFKRATADRVTPAVTGRESDVGSWR